MYEDEARDVLAQFLFDTNDLRMPLRRLSPGDQARAVLATLVARNAGLIALDEPTNHLDFDSLDRLEQALHAYRGTLVVVSYDRYFLRAVSCTRFWTIQNHTLHEVNAGDVPWL